MEKNISILKIVLLAAGFSDVFISEIVDMIEAEEPRWLAEPFEMTVGRSKVKGQVRIHLDETDGHYRLASYKLTLPNGTKAPIRKNVFLCHPWYLVSIPEAVNLMEGRYVYRKPELDPAGSGYWFCLDDSSSHTFKYIRNEFSVQSVVNETRIASWLGVKGWGELIRQLERGDRCDLSIGTGAGMRALVVEADPLGKRLRFMGSKGKELDIEEIMNRGNHVQLN